MGRLGVAASLVGAAAIGLGIYAHLEPTMPPTDLRAMGTSQLRRVGVPFGDSPTVADDDIVVSHTEATYTYVRALLRTVNNSIIAAYSLSLHT